MLTGNDIHNLIGQLESLNELFRVTDHVVEHFPRFVVIWRSEDKLFDLE